MADLYLSAYRADKRALGSKWQKRRRFTRRGGGLKPSVRSWLYRGLALLVIVGLAALTFWAIQSVKAHRLVDHFEQAFQQQTYEQAQQTLQRLKRHGEAGVWYEPTPIYQKGVQKASETVLSKQDALLSALEDQPDGALTDPADLAFLSAFKETVKPAFEKGLTAVIERVLKGEWTPDQAKQRLNAMMRWSELDVAAQAIYQYLPTLDAFKQAYTTAYERQQNADLVSLLESLKQNLPQEPSFDTLRQTLSVQLESVQKTWIANVLKRVEEAWEAGRPYWARQQLASLPESLIAQAKADIEPWQQRFAQANLAETTLYQGEIATFHVRAVVYDPARAMASSLRREYLQQILPEESILAIFSSLDERGYVLVDPSRAVDEQGRYQGVLVPKDKKPVVLVVDDLDYAQRYQMAGSLARLQAQGDQLQSVYRQANGEEVILDEVEVTGLLERYLQDHPHFSFDGARGVIPLTGNKAFLGWFVDHRQIREENVRRAEHNQALLSADEATLQKEREGAQAVAKQLLKRGWVFANAGYALEVNPDLPRIEFEQDLGLWEEIYQPLVGASKLFWLGQQAYPGTESALAAALYEKGYTTYLKRGEHFTIGSAQAPFVLEAYPLNALTFYFKKLPQYFDSKAVYRGIIHAKMYDPPRKRKKRN